MNRTCIIPLAIVLLVFMATPVWAGQVGNGGGNVEAAAVEKIINDSIIIDMRQWDPEKIRELGRTLESLPEPVASRALWFVAQAPQSIDTMQFFAQAIMSPSTAIRRQAADILVSIGSTSALRLILGRLNNEQELDTIQSIVDALAGLPESQAVTNLMEIMLRGNPNPQIVHAVAEHLRRLTRTTIPDTPVSWRDWWLDNSHLYR